MTADRSATGISREQIHAFEAILVLVIVAEYWDRLIKNSHVADAFLIGSAVAITICGGAILAGHYRRLAFCGIAVVVALYFAIVFPAAGNHEILQLLLCLLCAFVDSGDASERDLLVAAVRWTAGVILFWSGVQKLVHGYYFAGEYLAYSLSRESYTSIFSWLLSGEDLGRLAGYDGSPGTGPYRGDSPYFVLAANATYLLEITIAPLLLWNRTRKAAAAAAVLLLLAIESAARELFFFFILLDMLLLFLDGELHRRFVVPIALILCAMLLVRVGVLPEVTFN